MTPSKFLVRGLIAGLVAGLVAFVVAFTLGEPHVDAAIKHEEAGASTQHDHHHETADAAVVSRANQSTWGLLTGTLSIGVAAGGMVALAAAFALGRIGSLKPPQTTALAAFLGWVSLALVPFLKYPATPPAVGDAETIGQRTILYFALLAISVLAVVAATIAAAALLRNGASAFRATVLPTVGFIAVVGLAAALLPTVNEVGDFPGDVLWFFRRASLLTNAALWGTLGIVLTALIGRLFAGEAAERARRDLAASL